MLPGIHSTFVRNMMILGFCLSAGVVFGFGDFIHQINTPITPFGLTYIPDTNHLVVCQYFDGQAGRIPISEPTDPGTFEAMFTPIVTGRACGVAWCSEESVLYWLKEDPDSESNRYQLLRSQSDGWALTPGPEVDVPADYILGDIAYYAPLDAFATVELNSDQYIFISRETGQQLALSFVSPLQHPDAGIAYGIGLDAVPTDAGQLDILTGTVTDMRAMQVVRVNPDGTPTGIKYSIGIPDVAISPGWTTGMAYCQGIEDFTAIGDSFKGNILIYATPKPAMAGIAAISATVTSKNIGDGQTEESIACEFEWPNGQAFDSVQLQMYDPTTGEYNLVGSTNESAISHEIGQTGIFSFQLVPTADAVEAIPTMVEVQTGGGAIVGKASLGMNDLGTHPFAVTLVEKESTLVYVADLQPLSGTMQTIVQRFAMDPQTGALTATTPILSPFAETDQTVGLAWHAESDTLMWLGYMTVSKAYVIAKTDLDGGLISGPMLLANNPLPQDVLGDIACDSTGHFWVTSLEHTILFSFDGEGVCTGDQIILPTTLGDDKNEWGMNTGLSIIPGPQEGMDIFHVTAGIIPEDTTTPLAGTGFVKTLVPFIRSGETGAKVVGQPLDIAFPIDSALIRGVAVTTTLPHRVLTVAQDLRYLYALSLYRESPLFVRGDANTDNTINLADAVFILSYLFEDGDAPTCLDTADLNDNGKVNLSDVICTLRTAFGLSGDDCLTYPISMCGTDPTADALSCESYPICE